MPTGSPRAGDNDPDESAGPDAVDLIYPVLSAELNEVQGTPPGLFDRRTSPRRWPHR